MLIKKVSVMILAAGYGKRLRPITEKTPKPLIEIAGKTLLQNTLDHVLGLDFKEIIINTHYQHQMIYDFIKDNYAKEKIIISYEKELLDTGGGVKNALPLFSNSEALILNSDVFWKKDNFQDINNLINSFRREQKCRLLLVPKEKAHGIFNDKGDFIIHKGLIKKYKENQKKYFYAGAQIISLNLLKEFQQKYFSFNIIWDKLIHNKNIYGDIMKSDWYHIGEIKGLKEAKYFIS